MNGPFPPILHRKNRKYVKYSRFFLYCLDEKSLAQNCFARKKRDFCVGRGEKHRNNGYIFRAFSTKPGAKISFFALPYPYSARPKGTGAFFLFLSNSIKGPAHRRPRPSRGARRYSSPRRAASRPAAAESGCSSRPSNSCMPPSCRRRCGRRGRCWPAD